jgi:hypothetical protein
VTFIFPLIKSFMIDRYRVVPRNTVLAFRRQAELFNDDQIFSLDTISAALPPLGAVLCSGKHHKRNSS